MFEQTACRPGTAPRPRNGRECGAERHNTCTTARRRGPLDARGGASNGAALLPTNFFLSGTACFPERRGWFSPPCRLRVAGALRQELSMDHTGEWRVIDLFEQMACRRERR